MCGIPHRLLDRIAVGHQRNWFGFDLGDRDGPGSGGLEAQRAGVMDEGIRRVRLAPRAVESLPSSFDVGLNAWLDGCPSFSQFG